LEPAYLIDSMSGKATLGLFTNRHPPSNSLQPIVDY
jgi:hypothetical protein